MVTPTQQAAPATSASDDDERSSVAPGKSGDLFVGLGLRSDCTKLRGQSAANCRASGSPAGAHPTHHYGLDIHVSRTKPAQNILQQFAQLAWLMLLYLWKGIVVILDTALSLNPMSPATAEQINRSLSIRGLSVSLGWFAFALAVLAGWMVWRGLVQRRIGQAFAGVGLSVVMIVLAAALVLDPAGTAGRVADATNAAAEEVFASMSGDPGGGAAAVGDRQRTLFDMVAAPAWCTLQFGNVGFCQRPVPKDTPNAKGADTTAEVFLQYPAGAKEREQIHDAWRGHKDTQEAQAMQIQTAGGVGTRWAALALIAFAMVGAIIFFGALTIRLVAYAVMFLILLLFAPVMLVVACFGDAGRLAFIGWGRRLTGALVGKVVFSAVLAVTILASQAFALVFAEQFLLTWFLLGVLWWTMIAKHDEFAEWLSVGATHAAEHGGAGRALATAYHGGRALGDFSRAALRPGRVVTQRASRLRLATQEATRDRALTARRDQARGALESQLAADRQLIQDTEGEKAALRAELSGGTDLPITPERRRETLRELEGIDERLRSPEIARARANDRHAAANEAGYGISVTDDDADRYLQGLDTMSARQPSPLGRIRGLLAPDEEGPRGHEVTDPNRLVISGTGDPGWHTDHDGNQHEIPSDRDLRAIGTNRERHLRSDSAAQESDRRLGAEGGDWHEGLNEAAGGRHENPRRIRVARRVANQPSSEGSSRERLARGVAELVRQEKAGVGRSRRLTARIKRDARHRKAGIKSPPRIEP